MVFTFKTKASSQAGFGAEFLAIRLNAPNLQGQPVVPISRPNERAVRDATGSMGTPFRPVKFFWLVSFPSGIAAFLHAVGHVFDIHSLPRSSRRLPDEKLPSLKNGRRAACMADVTS